MADPIPMAKYRKRRSATVTGRQMDAIAHMQEATLHLQKALQSMTPEAELDWLYGPNGAA